MMTMTDRVRLGRKKWWQNPPLTRKAEYSTRESTRNALRMRRIPYATDGAISVSYTHLDVYKRQFIALCLRCGRGHIHLLFAHLVLVLLLPSVSLCLFELDGGKSPLLAIVDTEIFFLALVLPLPVFIQWADCQQDVSVGIVTGRVWIMNRHICKMCIRDRFYG